MSYSDYRCWKTDAVDKYIKTESRQKSREIFERTHLPIDRIKADFCKPLPDEDYISEEQFLDLILASEPENDNRIFLIVGETGSGKSEVCQWLEYNIDDDVHIPIHISRSTTSISKISSELDKHLDEGSTSEAEVKEITEIDSESLAKLTTALLETRSEVKDVFSSKFGELEAETVRELYSSEVFFDKLVQKAHRYQQNVKSEEREHELDLLTFEDFEDVCADAGIDFGNPEEVYSVLKREINEGLKENLHIGDFVEKLRRISEEYSQEGKRPVLILEDLTTFQFLKEDFMDYIFDISSGHYDVVIGWTTGFESSNIDHIVQADDAYSYMQERLQARFEMSAESGTTYFLEDRYADLTRKYLEAVFEESPECELIDRRVEAAFDGLFPFNGPMLNRIYNNLIEGGVPKQTPRLLLDFVVNPCLKSRHVPSRTVEGLEEQVVDTIPPVIDRQYPDEFRNFAKWYGNYSSETNEVRIHAEIPEILGVPVPDDVEQEGDELILGRSHSPLFEGSDDSSNGPDYNEINDIIQEHEDWLDNGSDYPSREEFRKGIIEAISRVGDPIELKNPRSIAESAVPIRYTRGADGQKFPVYIEDSGDDLQEGYYKVEIERDVENDDLYFSLLTLGIKGELPKDSNREQVRNWGRAKVAQHQKKLRSHIEEKIGMDIEEFVYFSKFLLKNLSNGSESPTQLKDPVHIRQIDSVDADLFQNRQEELVRYSPQIEGMFRSFFFLKDSMVDYEKLSKVSSEIEENRDDYLEKAKSMEIDLGKSFKVGSGNQANLEDLIEAVRDYCEFISKIHVGTEDNSSETGLGDFRSEMGDIEKELVKVDSRLSDGLELEDISDFESRLKNSIQKIEEPWTNVWGEKFSAIEEANIDLEEEKQRIQSVAEVVQEGETNPFRAIGFIHKCKDVSSSPLYEVVITVDRIVDKVLETDLPDTPGIEDAISTSEEIADYEETLENLQTHVGGCK